MSIEIRYLEHAALASPGETVLDALEKAGAKVPSSCRAGACQFCMMRLVTGSVPKSAQDGLKESLRETGHFLSCVCRPSESIVCEPANVAPFRDFVRLEKVQSIGPDVVLVRFQRPKGFEFRPGQFVTLRREDGLARSYSIASSAGELGHFDIHVRRVTNGRLSAWFHDHAKAGDSLWLEGPKGDCVYYPGKPDEPLILVGTGTGIAPLFAIAVDALAQGHRGSIAIYQGALSHDRLYFVDELRALAKLSTNVSYIPCVKQGAGQDGIRVGSLQEIVLAEMSAAQSMRVYLCGDPGLVRILKRSVFLSGVSMSRIHADPFVGVEPN